ncbi:MAG TPA: hypothetical protein VE618_06930 [Myxococcaceae bacterium]|nr:hypothetical protein [Myxococcaceae bacterium]
MISAYYLRPGGGFVVLVVALLCFGAFLAWGLRPAPLDQLWRIQGELDLGSRGPLSDRELALFEDTLRRHPQLADALLEEAPSGLISASESGRVSIGYAYLIRARADGPAVLRVTTAGASADEPMEIRVRAGGATASGVARANAPFEWEPPREGGGPQLIELRFGGEPPSPVNVELVERR